ncbi:hypothetical protein [Microlunatus ginsengisoli]|uniref:hypothetical protein n=1 Tax=Microlunatus ginsengisoli TaxID=363863 RepID=UPI0031D3E7D8
MGHQTGRGPRVVVVSYALTDDQVVFRIPEDNEIRGYACGRRITLNVSWASEGVRTEVVVAGVGFLPEHEAELSASVDLVDEWPSGISTHLLCLDLAVIEGTQSARCDVVGADGG